MKIEVNYTWRGMTPPAQAKLGMLAKKTLQTFFRGQEQEIGPLDLVCYTATTGILGTEGVKVTTRKESRHMGPGIPVLVHIEGTQGLECLMTSKKIVPEELEKRIKAGPVKKRQSAKTECKEVTQLSQEISRAKPDTTVQETVVERAMLTQSVVLIDEVAEVSSQAARPSPKEILLRSGNWTEGAVERLKGTLAYLLYFGATEEELNSSSGVIQLKVSKITQAILDHMEIPRNSTTGSYRGIIGSFYATVISLFAYKGYEDPADEEKYTLWMFDVPLVIDFIGGKDTLSALARERKHENEVRQEKEQRLPEPVSALEVKEAVEQQQVSDEEIFKLAVAALSGKRIAEEEHKMASANLCAIDNRIAEIEKLLLQTRGERASALLLVQQAEEKITSFTISKEILGRVAEARARAEQEYLRMQNLAKDLGI